MAIIMNGKGIYQVERDTWLDLLHGWCPFCEPWDSEIKGGGQGILYCENCDTEFAKYKEG